MFKDTFKKCKNLENALGIKFEEIKEIKKHDKS